MRLNFFVFAALLFFPFTVQAVDIAGAYPCINACVEAGGNLQDCARDCVSLNPTAFDTDGDGIPNIFELFYSTNPNVVDSLQDPDNDGLVNLQEFFLRSDPFDPNDPSPSFFVATDGINLPERGSREAPWRNIAYAISVLEPSPGLPVNIVLKSGFYEEDLILKPGVRLRSALFNRAIISGTIVGADACALQNISIVARRADDVLLTMDNVRMAVLNCTFNGGFFRVGTGALVNGEAGFMSIFENCDFKNLQIGLDIGGGVPLIRRNTFDNFALAAVLLRAESEAFPSRNLGSSEDAGSGWNVFGAAVDGAAVINERSDTVPMENNDWATDDPFSSDNRVDGPSDIEPFLASGSAVLAGAVYCNVWTTANQSPVTDATVSLVPSAYAPITQNVDGVYVFAAVPDGNYAATATHPTLGTFTVSVSVLSGGIVTANLPLGEEPIPTEPACGCNDNNKNAPLQAGDLLLGALVVALLFSRRSPSMKG